MDIYISIDGVRLNRAVARFDFEVGFARHADFDVQPSRIFAPIPVPVTGNSSGQFHGIPVLVGLDMEVLVQLETTVFDAKFDLLRVASGDAHTAVIGVHLYVGAAGHGIGLDDLFRLDPGDGGGHGQEGGTGHSQADSSGAAKQQIHGLIPPKVTSSH